MICPMTTPTTGTAPTTSDSTILTGGAPGASGGTAPGAPDAATPGAGSQGASAEGQPGAAAASGKAPDAAAPADIELKLPEGVAMDEALLGEFKPLAKELGLKSEGAQKLVDLFVKAQTEQAAKQLETFEAERKGWAESLKTDKDFGGSNFDANVVSAKRAVDAFDKTGELRKWLEVTGHGDNPVLVRTFAAIGKAMAEDSISGPSSVTATPGNSDDALLRQMYDHPSSAQLFSKE